MEHMERPMGKVSSAFHLVSNRFLGLYKNLCYMEMALDHIFFAMLFHVTLWKYSGKVDKTNVFVMSHCHCDCSNSNPSLSRKLLL